MRAKLLLPILAAALLCLAACDIEDFGGFDRYRQDFHYSYPLKSGGRLLVETFNGSVEVSGWDQETVDISGSKYGPTQEAADALKVAIDNSPDSVSIRVTRPSDRRGNMGARFVIKIPRAAYVDRIFTSNGSIRTQDGSGPARLRTSNAEIRVQALRGSLDAQTSNSSVELIDSTATPRPIPRTAISAPRGCADRSKPALRTAASTPGSSKSRRAGRCAWKPATAASN